MKKLRNKIFCTLFIIFTLFTITIISIFNFQSYSKEKNNIEQNLFRMDISFNKMLREKDDIPKLDFEDRKEKGEENRQRRFMDTTIYTVLLDDSNAVFEIISHTEDGTIQENVKKIAEEIIKNNTKNKTYIGNLYISNYSYKYIKNNNIVIIDNKDISKRLVSQLRTSIFIMILLEIVIILISKILSDRLSKPVEISFNKQKQFVADASHELKTPLSVIMACAETLENNPKEKKWLNNIKTESERMSKLIKSLLDLAKVENEESEKIKEETDFSKLIEKSVLPFESLAYEKDIKLDYDIEDNIKFKCHSEEIRELLSILLDNAIKHSPKNGKITVNLKQEKGMLNIEVINKGEPIPKGEEEKIFERFYRVDKARNRNENRYGLGLAIARSIVENHNGKIKASSTEEYTTFKVSFKK